MTAPVPYDPIVGLDPTSILSGQTGGVYVAPLGTAGPAAGSLMAAWPALFKPLGVIDESGLTESRSENRTDKGSWQYAGTVRSLLTSVTETFQFRVIETNARVISLVYKVNESAMTVGATGDAGVISFNTGARPASQRRAFGFDALDGALHRRFYVPNGEVTNTGDITYVTNDLIMYDLTVTAYPSTAGLSVARYFKEGWALTV